MASPLPSLTDLPRTGGRAFSLVKGEGAAVSVTCGEWTGSEHEPCVDMATIEIATGH